MADFCKECTEELFGDRLPSNVAGLCKEGEMTSILCEGCGEIIWVDHEGRKVKEQ